MRNTCSEQMSEDLRVAYRSVMNRYDIRTQQEAYERTVCEPAPRFYVNGHSAYYIIRPMLCGDYSKLERMLPLRQEMYKALLEVVLRLSRKREFHGRSPYYICKFAVNEPAPRFYIGVEKMRKVFRKWRKG